jgi:hypothetical protein
VNYSDLPRSGLLAPRLLRSGLPGSVSELAPDVGTAAPDSAGGFPLQAVRSVPLLPIRHSATTAVARFLSSSERASSLVMTKRLRRFEPRLNTAGSVAGILLPHSTVGVVNVAEKVFANRAGAVSRSARRFDSTDYVTRGAPKLAVVALRSRCDRDRSGPRTRNPVPGSGGIRSAASRRLIYRHTVYDRTGEERPHRGVKRSFGPSAVEIGRFEGPNSLWHGRDGRADHDAGARE